MSDERVSFVCLKAAELRKGKSEVELSQREAFVEANCIWRMTNE